MPVFSPHCPHDIFAHFVQCQSIWPAVDDFAIPQQRGNCNSFLRLDFARNVAIDKVMLAANSSVP